MEAKGRMGMRRTRSEWTTPSRSTTVMCDVSTLQSPSLLSSPLPASLLKQHAQPV